MSKIVLRSAASDACPASGQRRGMREEWWLLHVVPVSPGTPSDPRKHSPTPALCIQCMSGHRQSAALHAASYAVLPCCSCIQKYTGPTSRPDSRHDIRQEKCQGGGLSQSQLHVSAVRCRDWAAPWQTHIEPSGCSTHSSASASPSSGASAHP